MIAINDVSKREVEQTNVLWKKTFNVRAYCLNAIFRIGTNLAADMQTVLKALDVNRQTLKQDQQTYRPKQRLVANLAGYEKKAQIAYNFLWLLQTHGSFIYPYHFTWYNARKNDNINIT